MNEEVRDEGKWFWNSEVHKIDEGKEEMTGDDYYENSSRDD